MEGKSPGFKSQALGFCSKKMNKNAIVYFWKDFSKNRNS